MFKECSIKWKVLGVALIGPLVIAVGPSDFSVGR